MENHQKNNIIAALQLKCELGNWLTTNIIAAVQLFISGRAAVIFVERLAPYDSKPQRGDNIRILMQSIGFEQSKSF